MRKYLLALLLFPAIYTSAQTLDSIAVRRIGDYGRLWYVLSLFHPQMAYGTINQDSLYVHHVNALLANPSAACFRQAVNGMLSELHDASTYINSDEKPGTDTLALGDRPFLTWLPDSVALMYFDPKFMAENLPNSNGNGYPKLLDTLKKAHGLIFDLRSNNTITDDARMYYDPQFVKGLLGAFLNGDVSYPAYRSRIHYGHEDDYANVNFYFKGWLLQNGQRIGHNPTAIHKPVSLIINRFDNYLSNEIISFQKSGLARVVAEDSLPGFEITSPYQMLLADSVTVNIRIAETIYQDGSNAFYPDTLLHRSASGDKDLLAAAIRQLQLPPHTAKGAEAVQNLLSAPAPAHTIACLIHLRRCD